MSDASFQSADSVRSEPVAPPSQTALPGVRVRVIGLGGGGSNAVDNLLRDDLLGISPVVVNTDAQALNEAKTAEKLLVGRSLTRGLSTGGDPEIGRRVAQKDREQLSALVQGQDLVFIVAGLGGGTGSALAPALAQMAVAEGALVIGFVALPFSIEGQRRQDVSREALAALRESCDALLTLPNDLLMQHMQEDTTVLEAFAQANAWIARAIHSVCTMVLRTGMINIDLAALRTAFATGGRTLFGLGRGRGADCVEEALNDLLICPLLNAPEHNHRADKLLLNIVGSKDLGMAAINRILATVTEHFGSREHTLIGAVIDERLEQGLELCVIGTSSLDGHAPRRRRPDAVPSAQQMYPPPPPGGNHPGSDWSTNAQGENGHPNGTTAANEAHFQSAEIPGAGQVTFSQSMIPGTFEDGAAQADPSHPDEPVRSSLFARDEAFPGERQPARPVHESKLKQRKKQPQRPRTEGENQEEFLFVADGEQRGMFDRTPRNILDDIDLDIPTFQRRGIRIVLG